MNKQKSSIASKEPPHTLSTLHNVLVLDPSPHPPAPQTSNTFSPSSQQPPAPRHHRHQHRHRHHQHQHRRHRLRRRRLHLATTTQISAAIERPSPRSHTLANRSTLTSPHFLSAAGLVPACKRLMTLHAASRAMSRRRRRRRRRLVAPSPCVCQTPTTIVASTTTSTTNLKCIDTQTGLHSHRLGSTIVIGLPRPQHQRLQLMPRLVQSHLDVAQPRLALASLSPPPPSRRRRRRRRHRRHRRAHIVEALMALKPCRRPSSSFVSPLALSMSCLPIEKYLPLQTISRKEQEHAHADAKPWSGAV